MDVVERLTLEAAGQRTLLALTHVHRYQLAAQACRGKRTVDLCCGSGYGSALLREEAASVIGVDIDAGSVATANARFADVEGLEFVAADAVAYAAKLSSDEVDAIVCYEGLEHVADYEGLCSHLARLAHEGVVVVASMPNDDVYGHDVDNPYHVSTLGPNSFAKFCEALPDPQRIYQFHAEGSVFLGQVHQARPAGRVTLRDDIEREWAANFIAIANATCDFVDDADAGLLQVEAQPIHAAYVRGLERANHALLRENSRLQRERFGHHAAAAGMRTDRLVLMQEELEQLRKRNAVLQKAASFMEVAWREWYDEEEDPAEGPFRWGRSGSHLRLGLEGVPRGAARLTMPFMSFLEDRHLTVSVDGVDVASETVRANQWSALSFVVPRGMGCATVAFATTPGPTSASQVNPLDYRDISVAAGDPQITAA